MEGHLNNILHNCQQKLTAEQLLQDGAPEGGQWCGQQARASHGVKDLYLKDNSSSKVLVLMVRQLELAYCHSCCSAIKGESLLSVCVECCMFIQHSEVFYIYFHSSIHTHIQTYPCIDTKTNTQAYTYPPTYELINTWLIYRIVLI